MPVLLIRLINLINNRLFLKTRISMLGDEMEH